MSGGPASSMAASGAAALSLPDVLVILAFVLGQTVLAVSWLWWTVRTSRRGEDWTADPTGRRWHVVNSVGYALMIIGGQLFTQRFGLRTTLWVMAPTLVAALALSITRQVARRRRGPASGRSETAPTSVS